MILELKDLIQKYKMKISGVIHIGAHHGEEVKNYVNLGIENIVLFEPLEKNFDILQKNVSQFNANINGYCCALGNTNQQIKMFLSSNDLESSSVLKPQKHLELHSDVIFGGEEEVEMKRLDDFNFRTFNLINLDVQGYELEVLKGAANTLSDVDYVYCEVNRDEVYEGNAYIDEIDDYLFRYHFKRVETYWWENGAWGDALYVKQDSIRYHLSSTCQIENLDKIYTQYFGTDIKNRLFVEIGAYDGETVSNTSGLVDAGWRGIYVEPVHHNYLKCIERHKNNDVIVSNIAIGLEEGVQSIYTNGLLSSMEESHAELGITKFNYPQYDKDECFQMRMDSFLKLHRVPYNFDLLVVDVEGRENQVFDSFNLSQWRPQMMIVELVDHHQYFLDHQDIIEKVKNLRSYIQKNNYREIYRDEINTIFIDNAFF